jgi:hypothetical protein
MAGTGTLATSGCLYEECEWFVNGYGCAVVVLALEFMAWRSER